MHIELRGIGKKFKNEWIFHHLTCDFDISTPVAIIGKNGSGKTTLLKILSGLLTPTQGTIIYRKNEILLSSENIYEEITWAAPYIEVIEEFDLRAIVHFYAQLKGLTISIEELLAFLAFSRNHLQKPLKQFSSGMKQKVKLALAFYGKGQILLLDEPTSNLDKENTQWYKNHVESLMNKKIIIIASNQPEEYEFCKKTINIHDFKTTF
ncbi:MAG: ATP-binding cassette domain-containing protein [Flammeovirgaceae bacterium]|nr:ATP-binding cassette domain-containing protein [Flammeovirgaceae bacterium]MDW8288647.1 ATP-binding cassette domain-containing protein [Flammeovirgaceae bacterium]